MPEPIEQSGPHAAIEALLFAYGEPLEVKKIAAMLGVTIEIVRDAAQELSRALEAKERGLTLLMHAEREKEMVQLATKPEFSSLLGQFTREEFSENLTQASLETLSLIAYLGPLMRADIDYYRGVNSSFIVRSLLLRGIVERFPHPEKSATYLYQASIDLVQYLGLRAINELPEYNTYRALHERRREEGESVKEA